MFKYTIPALLIAGGMGFAGLSIGNAIKHNQDFNRYVDVKGLAEKTVKANEAIWQLSFNVADDDLGAAYQSIAKAQTVVKDFLQKQGFKADELELQPVSVVDNDANTYNTNTKGKRYSATGGVSLTTSQVDKVKDAIQATGTLVEQGVLINNSYVRYIYTELNSIKPGLLDEATTNAKAAAESFARNAHSQLGSIRQASQGLFTITDISETGANGADVMKKVRVVTRVQYFLR